MNILYRLAPWSVFFGQELLPPFWNLTFRNSFRDPKIFISDKINKKNNLELF